MVEYSDVFDEVDEFQKKAKSEEEIQKMCTKEDMTELQRACHLLKKGWELQKHSVINNLDRYLKEPGANDDLLRPILSSLDGWDEKLQIICANAFLPCLKKNLVHMENKQRILNLSVKITTDEHCQNESLINSWMEVFLNVIGLVDYEYAYMVSWKAIENIIATKNPMPRRKKGNKLLVALAMNFGEQAFDEHKDILHKIQHICGDTNFIIRLDGVQFLNAYLRENRDKLISNPRLKQVYLPLLYELIDDEEIFVRIEAIEAISNVTEAIETKTLEKELIPPLLKLLTLGVHDEIDQRMSRMIGSIIQSLIKSELHLKYKEQLLNYYKTLLDHNKDAILINACYNLPAFHTIYNKRKVSVKTIQLPSSLKPTTATTQATRDTMNDEEIKQCESGDDGDEENTIDFHQQYFTLAQESNEQIRVTTAYCLHEAFLLTGDFQDAQILRDTFHELLSDESNPVIIALITKIEKLISSYCNQYAINQLLPEIPAKVEPLKQMLDFQTKKISGGFAEFSKKQFGLKKQMTTALPDYDQLQDDDVWLQNQYLILPEYQSEQVYSKLLNKLMEYKQILTEKIALWRQNVVFLEALATQVHKFHVPEFQDKLVPILFEEIQRGNTQLRQAISKIFVMILANQQDSQRRKTLAEQVKSELGESAAFQLRKTYIFLCRYSVDKLHRQFFLENLFDVYAEMCEDKVPQVRMDFAKSLTEIKPFLEPEKQVSIDLNIRINHMKDDPDKDVADAIENTDYQLLFTRKKMLQLLDESEKRIYIDQKRLLQRETKENEEKKKRMEEDGENKYDYGSYGQTNRAGMFGGLKNKKAVGGFKSKCTGSNANKGSTMKVSAAGQFGIEKTKLKRTTTTVGKRNSSALPNSDFDIKGSVNNSTRKQSVLLPTFNSNLEGKGSTLTIPGLKELNKDITGGMDNYKRYQQMNMASAGGSSGGQVNGYKRSQSLLAEPSTAGANKSRLPKKNMLGGNDSSHQVTSIGGQPSTKQKNGYQKLKNQTRKSTLSSDENSSDDSTPQSKSKIIGGFKSKNN